MPQLNVEYSAGLLSTEQARGLALALHATLEPLIETELGSFKTRLTPLADPVIGDGGANHAMLHIDVAILSGRSAETKTKAGEAALSIAQQALLPAPPGLEVQVTVEVRDLDRGNYHKVVLG